MAGVRVRRMGESASRLWTCVLAAAALTAACCVMLLLLPSTAVAVALSRDGSSASQCEWKPVLHIRSLFPSSRRFRGGGIDWVVANSQRDVWIGGWVEVPAGPRTNTLKSESLLAHWNGRTWILTAAPPSLGEVTGLASSATGTWASVRHGAERPVLLFWDGKRWQPSTPPRDVYRPVVVSGPRGRVWLKGKRLYERRTNGWVALQIGSGTAQETTYTSRSSGEVWRTTHYGPAHARRPLLAHWHSGRWVQTSPRGLGPDTEFGGLVALSKKEAWLGATDGNDATLYRWNGVRWRPVAGPPPKAYNTEVHAAGGTIWLVNSGSGGGIGDEDLLRRDGTRWMPVVMPTRERYALFGLYHGPANEAWVVLEGGIIRRLSCA